MASWTSYCKELRLEAVGTWGRREPSQDVIRHKRLDSELPFFYLKCYDNDTSLLCYNVGTAAIARPQVIGLVVLKGISPIRWNVEPHYAAPVFRGGALSEVRPPSYLTFIHDLQRHFERKDFTVQMFQQGTFIALQIRSKSTDTHFAVGFPGEFETSRRVEFCLLEGEQIKVILDKDSRKAVDSLVKLISGHDALTEAADIITGHLPHHPRTAQALQELIQCLKAQGKHEEKDEAARASKRVAVGPLTAGANPSLSPTSPMVTDEHMEIVKGIIGADWVPFGRALLKYAAEQVRDIISRYANEQLRDSEKAYYVLSFWQQRDGVRATVDKLLEACEKINKRGAAELALSSTSRV